MCKKIVQNKSVNYQYFITKKLEAGIVLFGWEVKSIRKKKIEIKNGYIIIKKNEAYLYNIIINPLPTASSHINIKHNLRIRKLLLKKNELLSLSKQTTKKKHTIIPLTLYWKNNWIKIIIGIAIGKKIYDRRIKIKNREWILDKSKILK